MPNKNNPDELALLRSKVTELEATVFTLNQSLGESESNILLLRQSLGESESNILTLRQSLSESELTIQSLVEKLNLARRKRFGSSSETMPPQDLEFNEA
nr:hypothetical protein [Vibrio splendidus]